MDVTYVFEKHEDRSFSCFIEEELPDIAPIGYGSSVAAAELDMIEAQKELEALQKEKGDAITPTQCVRRKYDVGSFFDYFPINITRFARMYGFNASQLRQYVSLQREPSKKKKQQIAEAIKDFGNALHNNTHVLDMG